MKKRKKTASSKKATSEEGEPSSLFSFLTSSILNLLQFCLFRTYGFLL
jgi:hypothetical protein